MRIGTEKIKVMVGSCKYCSVKYVVDAFQPVPCSIPDKLKQKKSFSSILFNYLFRRHPIKKLMLYKEYIRAKRHEAANPTLISQVGKSSKSMDQSEFVLKKYICAKVVVCCTSFSLQLQFGLLRGCRRGRLIMCVKAVCVSKNIYCFKS